MIISRSIIIILTQYSTVQSSYYTCVWTQESELIENVEEAKDSDINKSSEDEKSKVQVMYQLIQYTVTSLS